MNKPFMHRSAKIKGDLHETPYSMTEQLLDVEYFDSDKLVLEPACGNGAIVKVLKRYGFTVDASDKYYGDNKKDFFDYPENLRVPYIITNPPYGALTDDFVIRAKKLCTVKFAFLLRTNYLSGQSRYRKNIYDNLKTVYVFNRMADLRAPLRKDGKYPTAGIVYAWFVWDMKYKGKPQIEFIDNSMFCLKKSDGGNL